ncbi:DUF3392 domain-containing protein [Halorhodospira halochloris]|uniref:DUF3392 family protein n=1 Tax=Halorhodospira halochloris TaxID=1052 RepID=UPI001EE8BC97|nr:DUF3392 family protein [Halorhodospira halochloris]MCG5530922.1 DUF3392 domain-containing protein [Halorhodospira halochloris]
MNDIVNTITNLLDDLLWRTGAWVNGYASEVALALVATLLVLYGDDINRTFARSVRPYPWIVRVISFVLMCAFGYGAITVLVTPLIAEAIVSIEARWVGLLTIIAFIAIGTLAERKRYI